MKHPTSFQKLLIRVKVGWLKLTGQQQAERRSAHQRDELAEPLLREEEEEREHDRLEDIQEVDLEAGQQGSSRHASSSRPNIQEDTAAERHVMLSRLSSFPPPPFRPPPPCQPTVFKLFQRSKKAP